MQRHTLLLYRDWVRVWDTFYSSGGEKPEGMCDSAWESMEKFVKELACGGGNFYDGWMPHSAMISCNDGFRPVSFYIEKISARDSLL